MIKTAVMALLLAFTACGGPKSSPVDKTNPGKSVTSIYDHELTTIDGKKTTLAGYKGKALLIVNTASECGYTGQYAGLQDLYAKRKDSGLVVLGFPSNQFGGQEPGSEPEIVTFVKEKYGVTFPMFAKVDVKGSAKDPLFAGLTAGGGDIRWNFSKFVVGRDGKLVARFPSDVAPDDPKLVAAIDEALR